MNWLLPAEFCLLELLSGMMLQCGTGQPASVMLWYLKVPSKSLYSAVIQDPIIFPLLPERQQKLRTQIVYNGLPKFLGRLLYAYLHPLLGADELSG